MNDKYFWWLCDIIGLSAQNRIAMSLHRVPFTWVHTMDENCYKNGLYLRTKYRLETGIDIQSDASCSVFEMLVSLISRLNNSVFDGSYRYSQMMWDAILQNLGLNEYSNDAVIESRCYEFMSGTNTLFPYIPSARTIRGDLWHQGHYWIEQNFPV